MIGTGELIAVVKRESHALFENEGWQMRVR